MPTQLETIIAILKRTGFITAVRAKRHGITNLRARINELRQRGYVIISKPYRRKDGREAVKYVFDEG